VENLEWNHRSILVNNYPIYGRKFQDRLWLKEVYTPRPPAPNGGVTDSHKALWLKRVFGGKADCGVAEHVGGVVRAIHTHRHCRMSTWRDIGVASNKRKRTSLGQVWDTPTRSARRQRVVYGLGLDTGQLKFTDWCVRNCTMIRLHCIYYNLEIRAIFQSCTHMSKDSNLRIESIYVWQACPGLRNWYCFEMSTIISMLCLTEPPN
jgi:hypothetical protein